MYGIYTYIWLIFYGFHVGKYTIPTDPMGFNHSSLPAGSQTTPSIDPTGNSHDLRLEPVEKKAGAHEDFGNFL